MLNSFHPAVRDWFANRFAGATPAQLAAWPRILGGENVLIAAPTGSGKTLAAFLACIDGLVRDCLSGPPPRNTRILYVSPLKALSTDIRNNLEAPLAGITQELEQQGILCPELTAGVRTGDTSPAERDRMRKRPPQILVTTPESLFILLTSESGRAMLSGVRTVIVDEIHALAGSKRGAHLMLSLARVDALCREGGREAPVRIGLSATQKPIEDMARYLCHQRPCHIVDTGHQRERDLKLEVPDSPLTTIMSHETWEEVYDRLEHLVEQHATTLIFVNTRRLCERLTHHLAERLGEEAVMAHHGSLAKEHRTSAEKSLKAGTLRAVVATASLELGIDIGDVELVCQLGSPRSIAAFLQRVGRSGHAVGETPKGRLFPLSLDDLAECTALMRSVGEDVLDRIRIPPAPLDVLAQQVIAEVAGREWSIEGLYQLFRNCHSYQGLSPEQFDQVLDMVAEGFATRRGRRSAYLHLDRVNGKVRARRSARLTALTNAGTIPDQFDYQVILRPQDLPIGTLNEDFAFESMPGNIFQLGNVSYRVLKVEVGRVFVEDANGMPPTVPFWLGEAPGRSDELSESVSRLRREAEALLTATGVAGLKDWLMEDLELEEVAADQLAEFLGAAHAALGVLPNHQRIVLERFFDEVGDMHLVIHSTYGSRLNRALGLSLRKRFCRKFNFELQASALDDTLVLSLGPTHSFPMDEVMDYLKPDSVRDVLIQAMLDAPMFPTHWRWNASIALAVKRMVGGSKRPPQFQRNDAEDLMAVVFPDQLACLENIAGAREVPDHPLVTQTIDDCLTDVMDIDGLEQLLRNIGSGEVRVEHRELVHPSALSESVINAAPFAFLDDGEAEDRRTRAIRTRRDITQSEAATLGRLDRTAVEQVLEQVQTEPRDADELHDLLMINGLTPDREAREPGDGPWIAELQKQGRAVPLEVSGVCLWVARERLHEAMSAYQLDPAGLPKPLMEVPEDPDHALVQLLRGRLESSGPVPVAALASELALPVERVDWVMLALESEGTMVRGRFFGGEELWCHRRLLARIHKISLDRKRSSVRPVDVTAFMRFLLQWHDLVTPEGLGKAALVKTLDRLEGTTAPVGALEQDVIKSRLASYRQDWLDDLCRSGELTWLRLEPPIDGTNVVAATPISLVRRAGLRHWLGTPPEEAPPLSANAEKVRDCLADHGASFANELQESTRLLTPALESALAELVSRGLVTADSFHGARYLVTSDRERRRRQRHRDRGLPVALLEEAGRWSLLRRRQFEGDERWPRVEYIAKVLLNRYGVMFRALVDLGSALPPWRDLLYVYRRMEAREEIQGGRFVDGFSGEQFALPEVPAQLRQARSVSRQGPVTLSAADPLNTTGFLLPGPRVPAVAGNRVTWVDGEPVAALIGGEIVSFDDTRFDGAVREAVMSGVQMNAPLRSSPPKTPSS